MSLIKFFKYCAFILLLVSMFLIVKVEPSLAQLAEHKLPQNAAEALANTTRVTLYSLESMSPQDTSSGKFYRYKILGKIELDNEEAKKATGAFQDAISGWNGSMAMCFEPHHAIRLNSNGHVYDYLLCYMCNQIEVYEDGKLISGLGATGSPDILNGLLTVAHVPLSYIYSPEYKATEKKRMQEDEDSKARWLAAMPESFHPLWSSKIENELFEPTPHPRYNPNNKVSDRRNAILKPFHTALDNEFPDIGSRILVLLKWYGSGQGPWSGSPSYEAYAAALLFDYSTQDIVATINETKLTEEQTEGASRFFGLDIAFYQPDDLKLLSPELKKIFLEHSLQSTDSDKIARAKHAFGNH